jgi:four helix bundle protein
VAGLISEGFEQSTDRHFAEYCCRSRGSSSETRTHLVAAQVGRHITEADRLRLSELYEEIAKMLSGLIRHLRTEDRKQRR